MRYSAGLLGAESSAITKSLSRRYVPDKKILTRFSESQPRILPWEIDPRFRDRDFLSSSIALNYSPIVLKLELKITSLFSLASSRRTWRKLLWIVETNESCSIQPPMLFFTAMKVCRHFSSRIGTRPKCPDRKSAGLEHTHAGVLQVLREEEH